jgi:voltage-gated potassium channel
VISPSLTPKGALIQGVETRFPWFLLATLLPILAMPFTNLDGNLAERICLPLVGLNLVAQSVRIMPANGAGLALLGSERLYSGLGLVAAIAVWLPFLLVPETPSPVVILVLTGLCSFYLVTAVRILQILAQVEGVGARTLCLGAAGYVHLGLSAGQLATLMQVINPSNFSLGTMLPGSEVIERLTYFAFITLGSIGYGDVLPATPEAEFFAVCVSITGTLYMSLVIGLLLSRYINDQTQKLVEQLDDDLKG